MLTTSLSWGSCKVSSKSASCICPLFLSCYDQMTHEPIYSGISFKDALLPLQTEYKSPLAPVCRIWWAREREESLTLFSQRMPWHAPVLYNSSTRAHQPNKSSTQAPVTLTALHSVAPSQNSHMQLGNLWCFLAEPAQFKHLPQSPGVGHSSFWALSTH